MTFHSFGDCFEGLDLGNLLETGGLALKLKALFLL